MTTRRLVPHVEALDRRAVPSPVGVGEFPPPPTPWEGPGPSPWALLEKASNDAIIEQAEAEYRATLARLREQLRLVETMEAETWYSQATDAIDRAIRVLIEAGVPMFPTVP